MTQSNMGELTKEQRAAMALGLWAPGRKCERPAWDCGILKPKGGDYGEWIHDHDIPCPTLTTDQICEALAARKLYTGRIGWWTDERGVGWVAQLFYATPCDNRNPAKAISGRGPTIREALIDICAQLSPLTRQSDEKVMPNSTT